MKKSSSRGSLTVEAAFTLSFFLLAMISWILLFIPYQVQSMAQHALDQSCLALADKISLSHTLSGKEGGLSRFAEALNKKKMTLPVPEFLREMGGNFVLELAGKQEFRHYFGSGKALPQTMHQVEYSVHVDDDRDILQAELSYFLDLPGILKPLGPLTVHQGATAGLWLLTDEPVFGRNAEQDQKKEEKNSVWKEPPFTRGRILVERFRQRSGAIRLQKGQIADLYYADGTLEALLSLNLFSSTYSTGSGGQAASYTLQKDAVLHTLSAQAKRLKRAAAKRSDWVKEDGAPLSLVPKAMRLQIIVPEEASHFSAELASLGKRIEQEEGVSITYTYEENALFPE